MYVKKNPAWTRSNNKGDKIQMAMFFFYKIDVNIKDELFYIFYNRENMCCNKKHLISKSAHEFWKNSQECMYNNYIKKI